MGNNVVGKIILYGLLLTTIGTFVTMYVQDRNDFKNSEQGKIESKYESKKDSIKNIYEMKIDSLEKANELEKLTLK